MRVSIAGPTGTEEPRAPVDARLLGGGLIVLGVAATLAAGALLLLYGVVPAIRRIEPGGRAAVRLLALYLCVVLAMVPGLAGALLIGRRPAARAWIVAATLAELANLAALGLAQPQRAWGNLRTAPGVMSASEALLAVGMPVAWGVALALLAARGRRWLPRTSASEWAVASACVAVVAGGIIVAGRSLAVAPASGVAAPAAPAQPSPVGQATPVPPSPQ